EGLQPDMRDLLVDVALEAGERLAAERLAAKPPLPAAAPSPVGMVGTIFITPAEGGSADGEDPAGVGAALDTAEVADGAEVAGGAEEAMVGAAATVATRISGMAWDLVWDTDSVTGWATAAMGMVAMAATGGTAVMVAGVTAIR